VRSSRSAAPARGGFDTIPQTTPPRQRVQLASRSELSAFLEGVERRAFKQAVFAVRDEEAALDIVQDAMLRLAEKYGHRPVEELPLLFHRIMQNANPRLVSAPESPLPLDHPAVFARARPGEEDDHDPLETLEAADGSNVEESPLVQLERTQVLEIIEQEIAKYVTST